ncbi:MAG: bi-domain-containing oxidoreductase, partial [bacterium]
MKQVIQNYKSGELQLVEVPDPLLRQGGVLLKTRNSLVSAGTEKLMISLAKKGYLGKAMARPDLVKQVISKIKVDGLTDAYKAVMSRLDTPTTLGYSSSGIVKEASADISGLRAGDRIACFGDGFATHSEMSFIPRNMMVKIPEGVSFEEAAFVGLGAIALNAIRVAELSFGESVAVIGLGLLGQISVQMLKAFGCRVIGIDISESKIKMAKEHGADVCILSDVRSPMSDVKQAVLDFTKGYGADAVIIMAGSEDNKPIEMAAEISRDQGRIVACGMVSLDVPRQEFFKKELRVIVSRATGPGKFDPLYENRGIDYPLPYVRWTTQRNMECFLELIKEGRVKLGEMITHRFKIADSLGAYETILKGKEPYLGVLLEYEGDAYEAKKIALMDTPRAVIKGHNIGIGLIGAGLHATTSMLPELKKMKGIDLLGIADAQGFKGEHVGKKYGFKYCVSDYKELLQDDKIDAVLIATRHNLHAEMVIRSLQAGKHVFVEKPLAMNVDEVKDIAKAVMNSKQQLMVGFNRRFAPHSIIAKKFLDNASNMVINCRVNAGAVPADSWVHDSAEGGGRVVGEVCHFVDLMQYLSGAMPVQVFAQSTVQKGDDNLIISLRFDNGSVGTILYASQGDRLVPRERIEVFSGNAVCIIDNFKSLFCARNGKADNKRSFGLDRGYYNEFSTFFESIRSGKCSIDLSEYIYTTQVTFAIMESLKNGRPVNVSLNDINI